MKARQKRYYEWVSQQPCLVAGCPHPATLHHVQGVRSSKTRQRLRRRQDLAEFAVVPLCKSHHQDAPDSVHNLGEGEFGVRHLGGEVGLLEWAYTIALLYLSNEAG